MFTHTRGLPLSMRVAAITTELSNIKIVPSPKKLKSHWVFIPRMIIQIEKNISINFEQSEQFYNYSVVLVSNILSKKIKRALKINRNSVFNVYILYDIHHYPLFSIVKMNYQIK